KAIAAADFNQDGKVDVALADPINNHVVLYPGVGDGSFGTGAATDAGQQPIFLSVADFNADGFPDLIVVDKAGNSVAVLMNKAH
ncbi:MAG TPA: VCBS repeat-containing protein, partial [Candidatus Acidoferrum sp.]|nr:VCBS repeat-containing protein [Candidatus Acidoferrum sp.]